MLNADTPRTLAMLTKRKNVSADIDQCVMYALLTQQFGSAIQRITFSIAAEVKLYGLIFTAGQILFKDNIVHLRVGCDPLFDEFFIRMHRFEFIGLKTPQPYQTTDSRVEQAL